MERFQKLCPDVNIRDEATINGVKRCLEHDNHANRSKIRDFARKQRRIFLPRYDVSLREQRELAYEKCKAICSLGILSVKDFSSNPENIFSMHEEITFLEPSFAIKMTVQFNLFGGTLWRLGGEYHRQLAPGIDRFQEVGCFALTELGFGNNAVEMETVAIYDHERRSFRITSPTILSQKYWITNGAVHAQWAIIFAQLHVGTEKLGVHGFLVRIRDEAGRVAPGVKIEDMGVRIGVNGVDNAKLTFQEMEVPRESMLPSVSRIDDEGRFTSRCKSNRERFIAHVDQLLSGRVCIANMMIASAKVALVTTMRYSCSRMGVGESSKSDAPIGSYKIVKSVLVKLWAQTMCINVMLNHVKEKYRRVTVDLAKYEDDALIRRENAELLIYCCFIKPVAAWHAERTVSACRECSGGQGFLACNQFGEYWALAHAGITAEGDSKVLFTKVAKELLSVLVGGIRTPISCGGWCEQAKRKRFPDTQTLYSMLFRRFEALYNREADILKSLGSKTAIYESWMCDRGTAIQKLSWSFSEWKIYEAVLKEAEKFKGSNIANLLTTVATLFALLCVQKDLQWFAVQASGVAAEGYNRTDLQNMPEIVDSLVHELGGAKGEHLVQLSRMLGVPEDLLVAPIAADWVAYNDPDVPKEGHLI